MEFAESGCQFIAFLTFPLYFQMKFTYAMYHMNKFVDKKKCVLDGKNQ